MSVSSPNWVGLRVVSNQNPKQDEHGGGRFAHTVYQEDLEECMSLQNELIDAERAGDARLCSVAKLMLKSKRCHIEAALRSGARVEPGAHRAEMVPSSCSRSRHLKLEIR